jgi:Zn-dependent peptidase ImmA (M78 family)
MFGIKKSVQSVLNLVSEDLGILVIWQKLPLAVAGYAVCDEIHGPAVVVNVNGRNANELVRRFTLAHEAAHVLYDREHLREMASFDEYDDFFDYLNESRDPRETRANAFAIQLLAPEPQVRDAWRPELGVAKAVRKFMTEFGLSFEAARCHLANYGLLDLTEKVTGVVTTAPDDLKVLESPELWYPAFDSVPIERRHSVAPLGFKLWREGVITIGRLREVLGCSLGYEEIRDLAELYLTAEAA